MRSFQQNSCHQNTARRGTQTLTDVFDVTSSICDFRAHIFCPQTTQKLPKKHHEAGPPEQLPTDVSSQIKSITDTLDTVKIAKRFACANEQRKEHFGKFE